MPAVVTLLPNHDAFERLRITFDKFEIGGGDLMNDGVTSCDTETDLDRVLRIRERFIQSHDLLQLIDERRLRERCEPDQSWDESTDDMIDIMTQAVR